jgi:eukaryotic-like serine/threonine-protein kinase
MAEKSSWGFREGDEIVPGRYATRLLGGGRRYEAYLAWDDAMHALVVAKVLRPELVEEDSARAGLAGEAEILASLAHPVIVRAFDAVLDGARPHLVLEYLDGPRLSTLIRRYGVIVEQLLPLAIDLCSALHYLHGRDTLHLDVKPRNVVMSSRPRLIDLSVAMTLDRIGDIKRPVGTDAYMAPEQCDPGRFAEIGPASDVWGLGVTLYEALARGTRPFDHAVADDTPYPQLHSAPAPLPGTVPAPIAEAVYACLSDRPEERPSPSELAAALEPLAAALPAPRIGRFRPGGRAQQSVFAQR